MEKVLVFGRGQVYRERKLFLREHYEIVAFLDNKVQEQERQLDEETGLPVCNPDDVSRIEGEYPILLMARDYEDMLKQLQALGVEPSRIQTLDDVDEMAHRLMREKYRRDYPMIQAITDMPTQPVSRSFGMERGSAIDRYYIERFLEDNRKYIRGDCLEIAENTYTKQYGQEQVEQSLILHVEGWGENAIKGNLATGEGIIQGMCDCAIITQTLMFIYDIGSAAENIYKMLKPDGTALITVSGIGQISRYDADRWGSFYNFHEGAMHALFEPVFGKENVIVRSYGNVKTAIAMLYGLCCEDLATEDFEAADEDYPVIISVVLRKR